MGNITDSSLAAGISTEIQNEPQETGFKDVERKIVIIGTKDVTKTALTVEVPFRSLSPEYTGSVAGLGSMLHRLHLAAQIGSQGKVATWIQPQAEAGASTAAAGQLDFTGSTGVKAGVLALYISNQRVPVAVTDAMTIEELADAVVAKITADPTLPVTAVKVAVTFQVTITSKSKGTWGNDIPINLNNYSTDVPPTGIITAITSMATGAGLPDITTALNGLGTGDGANEDWYTALIHGYGQDATTLAAIQTYVGATDDLTGLYSGTSFRPFYSKVGDVVADVAGLTALLVTTSTKKTDRSTGIMPVPGSKSNVHEIAAQQVGVSERIAVDIVAQGLGDEPLTGVHPGAIADRWTNEYTSGRDVAVKAGIGTTLVKKGVVYIQDDITMSRPDDTPVASNAYREVTNIKKIQNMGDSIRQAFSKKKWQGIFIVADIAQVTSTIDKTKARDPQSVLDELYGVADYWASKGWIYESELLKKKTTVTVRAGADGFSNVIPAILSGVGKIFDNRVNVDTSIAILL